jgi:hypothetical protein
MFTALLLTCQSAVERVMSDAESVVEIKQKSCKSQFIMAAMLWIRTEPRILSATCLKLFGGCKYTWCQQVNLLLSRQLSVSTVKNLNPSCNVKMMSVRQIIYVTDILTFTSMEVNVSLFTSFTFRFARNQEVCICSRRCSHVPRTPQFHSVFPSICTEQFRNGWVVFTFNTGWFTKVSTKILVLVRIRQQQRTLYMRTYMLILSHESVHVELAKNVGLKTNFVQGTETHFMFNTIFQEILSFWYTEPEVNECVRIVLLCTCFAICISCHSSICQHLQSLQLGPVSPFHSQFTFSLLIFIIDNISLFKINSDLPDISTRDKVDFHRSQQRLSIYSNGVYYTSRKAFSHSPSYIRKSFDNKNHFKNILKTTFHWLFSFIEGSVLILILFLNAVILIKELCFSIKTCKYLLLVGRLVTISL